MRRFEGRVAVVSGAAQGMGKAVALRLGEEGATIVAVDINETGASVTAQSIGGRSIGVGCDIGDEEEVAGLFDTVAKRFGKLDVLVNAAAIVPFVKWDALTFSEWRRVLRVNLDGLYLMCRAGSDLMRKNQYGRIVNFSSNSIFAGTPNMAHYVASKGGVLTFTRALATELGPLQDHREFNLPGTDRYRGRADFPSQGCFRIRRDAAGHQGPRRCPRTWFRPSLPRLRGGAVDHGPGAQRRRRHGALVEAAHFVGGASASPGRKARRQE